MIKNVKPQNTPNIIIYFVESSSHLSRHLISNDGVFKVEIAWFGTSF
jgi:hypothetical protein